MEDKVINWRVKVRFFDDIKVFKLKCFYLLVQRYVVVMVGNMDGNRGIRKVWGIVRFVRGDKDTKRQMRYFRGMSYTEKEIGCLGYGVLDKEGFNMGYFFVNGYNRIRFNEIKLFYNLLLF